MAREWADGLGSGASRVLCVAAYAVAGAAAVGVGLACIEAGEHPLLVAAVADLVATALIFAGSFALGNSSLYDPYWSVVPTPIALYWALGPGAESGASGLRQALAIALVVVWGVRLTRNWLRSWPGWHHEDWRYVDMRASSGRGWWIVSFFGIHLFPTVVVFLGLLPLYPALVTGTRDFGVFDLLAAALAGTGILLELVADEQLRSFVRSGHARGATLQTGLWGRMRHPNYLGENLFWWGLFGFGLAADPGAWWTGIGAVAMTVMFLTASIPMIERRMLERRPDYAAYRARVPSLLPRPWRS